MYTTSKEKRKETYEQMLKDFEEDKLYNRESGFCRWLVERYSIHSTDAAITSYPELLKQRPPNSVYGVYWWDVSPNSQGRIRRIEGLKKALKILNKTL